MQRNGLATLVKIGLCAMLALGAVAQLQAEDKVNAMGTWTWEGQARGGGNPPTITLKLKMDGDKIVGTLARPGRGRRNAGGDGTAAPTPAVTETKIEDAKVKGDEISFSVTMQGRGGNPGVTMKYTGKIKGDMIEGKIEAEGRDPQDWKAKRAVDKKDAGGTDGK